MEYMDRQQYMDRYGLFSGYVGVTNKHLSPKGTSSVNMMGVEYADFKVVKFGGRLHKKRNKHKTASVWECETKDGYAFLITGNILRKLIKNKLILSAM